MASVFIALLSATIVFSLGLSFEAKWAVKIVAAYTATFKKISVALKPALDKFRKNVEAYAPILANVMLGIGSSLISVALTIVALQREDNIDATGLTYIVAYAVCSLFIGSMLATEPKREE
jgi:hypothetical protein